LEVLCEEKQATSATKQLSLSRTVVFESKIVLLLLLPAVAWTAAVGHRHDTVILLCCHG
jgi:uncharacterized membrane protein